MTYFFLGLYIICVLALLGIFTIIMLAYYEYKDYIRRIEQNDESLEDPPLIKK